MKYMLDKHSERMDTGDVQNTTVMAELHSTGVQRFGVLRMDVDWLGSVFQERLAERDMLHTSALSAALSLFFEGWLNRVCESVAESWPSDATNTVVGEKAEAKEKDEEMTKSKLPYIIYSGGDDLFIVGPWDVMPVLAERIRNDFRSYVTRGYVSTEPIACKPCMTISAGISIFHPKFPIYQAAELAKAALDDEAKGRKVKEGDEEIVMKDAIDFLGVTVGWEEFDAVKRMAFQLAKMVNTKEYGQKAPRSLLTMLKTISDSYKRDAEKMPSGNVVYGRWMWRLAYSLQRMKERTRSDRLKEQIMKLSGDALDLGKSKEAARWRMIRHLGLPVRWTEFLTRKEGGR